MTSNGLSTTSALLILAVFAGTSAQAAPVTDRVDARIADAGPVRPVAMTEGEDEAANCNTSRRRLWIEGEGWIVRRITVCR